MLYLCVSHFRMDDLDIGQVKHLHGQVKGFPARQRLYHLQLGITFQSASFPAKFGRISLAMVMDAGTQLNICASHELLVPYTECTREEEGIYRFHP